MPERSHHRQFSEEDNEAYRKSIEMMRTNLDNGVKFDLACEFVTIEDRELRELIIDDALKIEIAELHYGKRMPLLEVSKRLGVSMDRLLKASSEMLEDVIQTTGEFSGWESGGKGPMTH
jgi:hypothetical protein